MVDLMHCLVNLIFFDIPLLYCYTNLNSSIICYLFSVNMYLSFGTNLNSSIICYLLTGDMHLSFGTSVSLLVLLFSVAFSVERSSEETLVILSAILLPIKSQVASAFFELLFLNQFLFPLL